MKNAMAWFWRFAWLLIGLIELYIGVNSPMPKGLVSLAIGGGILVWQGLRLQQYLQSRK